MRLDPARIAELFGVTEAEVAALEQTERPAREEAERIRAAFHARIVAAAEQAERDLAAHLADIDRNLVVSYDSTDLIAHPEREGS